MKITSTFNNNELIPEKYTAQGQNINPPLTIEDIPKNTVSMVLIIDDPDAPMGTWDHWILFNIAKTEKIEENSVPKGAIQAMNSWRKNNYGGPNPPSGTHRYFFKLYALNNYLNLTSKAVKQDVEKAMQPLIIAKAELIGTYKKK
jgi:Raf kinase inhibitor-like YbhB/YbcL family protein